MTTPLTLSLVHPESVEGSKGAVTNATASARVTLSLSKGAVTNATASFDKLRMTGAKLRMTRAKLRMTRAKLRMTGAMGRMTEGWGLIRV
jgi:hypothetical protein